MDVTVKQVLVQESDADAIVIGLFEGDGPKGAAQAVDQSLDGAIRSLIDGGDLSGEVGDVAVLYPRGAIPALRVIVAGLGPRDGFDLDVLRRGVAYAI
jgi:leucyl aminopeptidase